MSYNAVERIYPSRNRDDVYDMLLVGDKCKLDVNIVRIFKNGREVHTYVARADRHGPEYPFLIQPCFL